MLKGDPFANFPRKIVIKLIYAIEVIRYQGFYHSQGTYKDKENNIFI